MIIAMQYEPLWYDLHFLTMHDYYNIKLNFLAYFILVEVHVPPVCLLL